MKTRRKHGIAPLPMRTEGRKTVVKTSDGNAPSDGKDLEHRIIL